MSNIPPIFFTETLADLKKEKIKGRTPEKEVAIIAAKTPELHSYPNAFHLELCIQNIHGHTVQMDGRPQIMGGKPVRTQDRKGFVYEESREVKALSRWQKGEFYELERDYAQAWRKQINSMNFHSILQCLKAAGINHKNCKSFDDAKKIANLMIQNNVQPASHLALISSILGIPLKYLSSVLHRLPSMNIVSLVQFAPYVAFVMEIEFFFYIAVASRLLSSKKVTNKIDLSYMFYLPFCMVFVSSDKFHKNCAPHFLREDQQFIWGPDLKSDLKKIDQHYSQCPDEVKEKGLDAIAPYPPIDSGYLTTRLWDRYLPRWRNISSKTQVKQDRSNKKLVKYLNEFAEAPEIKLEDVDFDSETADAVLFKRNVKMQRGKWWQVPKDIKNKAED